MRNAVNTVITSADFAAAHEIAAAHLGVFWEYADHQSGSLDVLALSKNYTHIDGEPDADGSTTFYAEVSVLNLGEWKETYLRATLVGATYDVLDKNFRYPFPQAQLNVRTWRTRDQDHTCAYLAYIKIDNPVVSSILPGRTTIIGHVQEGLLYPLGTDITRLDTDGNPITGDPKFCDSESCAGSDNAHTWGPFTPPIASDLTGKAVQITLTDQQRVDKHGRSNGKATYHAID